MCKFHKDHNSSINLFVPATASSSQPRPALSWSLKRYRLFFPSGVGLPQKPGLNIRSQSKEIIRDGNAHIYHLHALTSLAISYAVELGFVSLCSQSRDRRWWGVISIIIVKLSLCGLKFPSYLLFCLSVFSKNPLCVFVVHPSTGSSFLQFPHLRSVDVKVVYI